MTAHWRIKTTGEELAVLVTANHDAFIHMLSLTPQIEFLRWE